MYNKEIKCIKSGNIKDVVEGETYYVVQGFLHTNFCPWAREQEEPYLDINNLNEKEILKGNQFIEI